ncbi:MAG: ATP-binding protein, partial [Ilumatobacteraceae bacterium]
FCIAREALRNASEHGQARRVEITLRDGDMVELTIRDDGCGFAVPDDLAELTDGGHFGVIGMRERAESVGGSLTVSSRAGSGTTVHIRVPRTTAQTEEAEEHSAVTTVDVARVPTLAELRSTDLEARP